MKSIPINSLASELVGIREIAARRGVTPQVISNWRQRKADFPTPVAELSMGPVWIYSQILPWLKSTEK
jgi:chromosome partitioning protein